MNIYSPVIFGTVLPANGLTHLTGVVIQ